MLFIGAVVFAAYFLKRENIITAQHTVAQTSVKDMDDDDHYPYHYSDAMMPVKDTLKLR